MKQRNRKHIRPVRDRWFICGWAVDVGADWRAEVADLTPTQRQPPLPVYNEVWRLLGLRPVTRSAPESAAADPYT